MQRKGNLEPLQSLSEAARLLLFTYESSTWKNAMANIGQGYYLGRHVILMDFFW